MSQDKDERIKELKAELRTVQQRASEYVNAEQRLRIAREGDSDIKWQEALYDVLDARSALVPHIFSKEDHDGPTRAKLEAKNERVEELEWAVGAALYHIDHEDASLSGHDVKHMLKARQHLADVMGGKEEDCTLTDAAKQPSDAETRIKDLKAEVERLRRQRDHYEKGLHDVRDRAAKLMQKNGGGGGLHSTHTAAEDYLENVSDALDRAEDGEDA